MGNLIGRAHKLGKQKRQRPGNTNGTLNTNSPTPNFHDKSAENIDDASKKPQSVDSYSSPKTAVKHTSYDIVLIGVLQLY